MKALKCKPLITGIGGGLALSKVEAAWDKLTAYDQEKELSARLAAAEKAAQQDNMNYELIDQTVFLLGTTQHAEV